MHSYEHFWHDPKFWVAVSFVLFFLLLGKKLWGAISTALDGRAANIRRQLDEAARLRGEAEQMLKDAETERATAAREAEELLVNARAEADQNAAKFGRTRAERDLQARQQALDQARLDQHRLEDE